MGDLGLSWVLGPALGLGIPGILFVVWYFDGKARDRDAKEREKDGQKYREDMMAMITAYREDTKNILAAYQGDMLAMRQMYENNVLLVKNYQTLCGDLKDIVILNSKGFQALDDSIKRKCAALKDG
ncbi:MAG: hypothetical protein M1438_01155 [Deltaproteobacteria bacterium]|nr:hypothetical protein [Deltaproteobacteria bacterium]